MEPEKDLEAFAEKRALKRSERGGGCSPNLGTAVKMFPTPTAGDHTQNKSGYPGAPVRPTLIGMARYGMWPTPAARDSKGANSREHCETNGTGRKHMDQLANAVAYPDLRWATPQARDFRTGSLERWENPERSRNLNDQVGGQLNPMWVEWLMGWPLGWTDCAASATAKFPQWLRSHGVSSPAIHDEAA